MTHPIGSGWIFLVCGYFQGPHGKLGGFCRGWGPAKLKIGEKAKAASLRGAALMLL